MNEQQRDEGLNTRNATQIDEGWRVEGAKAGHNATQVDEGWRREEAKANHNATQVDEGWRQEQAMSSGSSTVNAFSNVSDFQVAVGKLTELRAFSGVTYPIKKTLSRDGGESAILLCVDRDGRDVVAKVYYDPENSAELSVSARKKVLEYMQTEEGKKYTLAVSDTGNVELGGCKYYFEIMPYCSQGDLSKCDAFSFEEIVEIAEYLNEALHSMHQAGILHRDIKPANIYRLEDRIVIGDFGVAKLATLGKTSHVAGTYGYQAPETQFAISSTEAVFFFDQRCDYYSLGVTLGSLFEGHFVYDDMDVAMVTVAYRQGKIPLKKLDPNRAFLENLLNGLCKYDPTYRFGYADVKKWLDDHNYTGGVAGEEWPKAFRMLGEEYRDERSLFEGITRDNDHWDEGVNLLYGKFFENFFMSFRTDVARAAQRSDELWRKDDKDKGLAVFLKSLFAPGPIVWKGYTFNSLNELANKMVATKTPEAYGEILQKQCISHWLSNTAGIKVDDETKKLVDEIEALSVNEPELACYWFGNSFASKKYVKICDHEVSTLSELTEALFSSPSDFYQKDGLQKLENKLEGADLYGFLYSFGYRSLIDKSWEELRRMDEFNKVSVLFTMLDNIMTQSSTDAAKVRDFFMQFGPIGIATYTKQLLAEMGDKVYKALDVDGKQTLSKISEFFGPVCGTVEELFRGYNPLVEHVERLSKNIMDNPFCVMTGVYENKGVICTDLMGCFAFKIFGRIAPLGFSAWIENANGGTK